MKENATAKTVHPENTEKSTTNRFGLIPYIIAIGVIIAYGFFMYYLIGKTDAKALDWSRLIYLFSGVEAIVFAAVGFLFGREVNRKRAENAEVAKKEVQQEKKQVEIAKQQAEKRKEVAEKQVFDERKKGLMLGAMAIQAERTARGVSGQGAALEGMALKPDAETNMAMSARSMYPELKGL